MPCFSVVSTSKMLTEIHLPAFFLQGSHWSHGPCPSQPLALKYQWTRERKASTTIQEIRKRERIGIEKMAATHCTNGQSLHSARLSQVLKTKVDAAVLL